MAEYKLNYTGAQINAALGKVLDGVPYNLLDNSWFVNPVNQRGATSVVDNWKYIADRWVCTNVSSDAPVIINANDITLNNTSGTQTQAIRQYLNIKDGTYTCAAKTDSIIWIICFKYSNGKITKISSSFDGKGQIYVATSGDNIYISIQAFAGYSIKVVWAALYEGSYTADTLPAYVPKDNELAECKLHHRIMQTPCIPCANNQAGKQVYGYIQGTMRIAPTVICDKLFYFHGDGTYVKVTGATAALAGDGIRIAFDLEQSVSGNLAGVVGGTAITFDANM